MEIHIERAGEKFGPYSQAEVRKHLANGDLVPSDLAWHKGQSDWTLLSSMFPDVSGPAGLSRGTRPPRPARKYHRWIIAGVVILAISYLLSPYYFLWRLNEALESGDQKKLETRIDFVSVRAGLKEDLGAHFDRMESKKKTQNDDPFGNLLASIAKPLMESMIESMVTPSGLAALIAESKAPQADQKSDAAKTDSSQDGFDLSKIDYAFFTSPARFLVDVNSVKLRMLLSRSGWQVVRLEVSPEVFESGMR